MLQTRNGKRTGGGLSNRRGHGRRRAHLTRGSPPARHSPTRSTSSSTPHSTKQASRTSLPRACPLRLGRRPAKSSFNSEEAETQAAEGQQVILVRQETSPEDIGGMDAAQGILTARGGASSHAALVARGMGKCCVRWLRVHSNRLSPGIVYRQRQDCQKGRLDIPRWLVRPSNAGPSTHCGAEFFVGV